MRRPGGILGLVALLVGLGAVIVPARAASGDVISTYAGGLGSGEATNVGQTPAAIAVDEERGFVYVADTTFNVLRRIDVSTDPPTEEVFAGTGEVGFSGDGGPATEATLAFRGEAPPSPPPGTAPDPLPGLAVDSAGNLYIADSLNHRIRMVDAAGVITTVAGTGEADFANGSPSSAKFNQPSGLAVDAGDNLYIADSGNHRVRLFVPAEDAVVTFAGTGTAGYSAAENGGPATSARLHMPTGVALRGDNLYIADKGNCRVRKVDSSLDISTYAGIAADGSVCGYTGEGDATEVQLNSPHSVTTDSTGNLYIADTDNCLVRKVEPGGELGNPISTVAGKVPDPSVHCGYDGEGTATAQMLSAPFGVATQDDEVLVADTANFRVRALTGTTIATYAGNGTVYYSGDGEAAVGAQLDSPWGTAVAADGSVYVSDWSKHVVRKIDPEGVITTVAGTGAPGYSGDGGPATGAQLDKPMGLAVDGDGNLFIADSANCVIRKVDADGVITVAAGQPPDGDGKHCGPSSADPVLVANAELDDPGDVAVDADASLLVANTGDHTVIRVGTLVAERVTGTDASGSGAGQLDTPRGIAVDAEGAIYVADTLNSRIQMVEDDTVTTFAGMTGEDGFSGDGGPATSAKLRWPRGVEAGPGGVYISDTHNYVVRQVDESGTISTVAGEGGVAGFDGDGGPPTSAHLDGPHIAAVTADGVLYVADRFNQRVRRVGPPPATAPGPPTAVSGEPADGEVTVTWSPPLDDGGAPVDTYRVYQDGGEEPVATVTDGSGAATVTGLTNGTEYTFGVTAANEVGEGDAASTGPVTPRTVPGAPTGVSANAGDGEATVSWSEPASDGGAAITSYEVTASPGGKTATAGASATFATVTGLTNGTSYTFTVRASNEAGPSEPSAPSNAVTPQGSPDSPSSPSGGGGSGSRSGYWMLGEPGAVHAFGDALHAGNATPVGSAVDIEATPTGNGYWVLDEAGYVYTFGDAGYHGGLNGGVQAGEQVTSMSATPSGNGYWLFSTAGRVAVFGDAADFGDMSGTTLNGPVLDSVATPSGQGYYMVASDGGVFSFGDAAFHGSMGGKPLNQPVQSLTADPDGTGYWLVASDGGIFAFEAPFHGSMGGQPLNQPVTRMVAFGSAGYLMVATDGGIFSFGSAPFHGSLGAEPPPYPIRSVSVLNVP